MVRRPSEANDLSSVSAAASEGLGACIGRARLLEAVTSASRINGLSCRAMSQSALLVLQMAVAGMTVGAAVLLGVAGVGKLVAPGPTVRAVRSVFAWAPHWSARLLGTLEVAVAAAFLIRPGAWTALVLAAAYAGLLGFVALARGKADDCGCFGESSAPIETVHIVVCAIGTVGIVAFALLTEPMPSSAWAIAIVGGAAIALVGYGLIGPASRLRSELAEVGR